MNAPLLNRITLSAHLEERLRTRLKSGRGGLRLPTEKELAQEFGVSVPLVRRALETLEAEQLVESVPGRGWKIPADAKEPCVAILYDLDIAAPRIFRAHLLRIQESRRLLEAAGYRVSIYLGENVSAPEPPTKLACPQFLSDLNEGRFSAVICPWAYPDPAWTGLLKEAGIPMVGFGLLHENMVSHDFEAYVRLAIEVFKQRNRRRIACVGAVSEWNREGYDRQRFALTTRLLQEAGFEVEESWVRQDWHHSVPAAGWSSFREIWTRGPKRPDGLLLNSAMLWPDVQQAIHSLQIRMPEDLDVVISRENLRDRARREEKGVTEFLFDTRVMVRKAVEMLLDLMNGRPLVENRCFVNAWQRAETTAESQADTPRPSVSASDRSFALTRDPQFH